MSSTSSFPRRQPPRLRALVVGVVGFLVLFGAAVGSKYLVSFSPTVKPLNVVAPVNQALFASLPQGPHHVTLSYTSGTPSNPNEKFTLSGYINFSGVDQTACSMLLSGTVDLRTNATGAYTSHAVFTEHKAPGQVAFVSFSSASGNYQGFPTNVYQPFDDLFRAHIPLPMPAFLAVTSGELCGFDQMARYATLGTNGAIAWNSKKFAAVQHYYTASFFRTVIAASKAYGAAKNSAYNGIVLSTPLLGSTPTLDAYAATLTNTLTTSGGALTYTQSGANAVTITFTPAPAQTVPNIAQQSYLQESTKYAKTGASPGATPGKYTP